MSLALIALKDPSFISILQNLDDFVLHFVLWDPQRHLVSSWASCSTLVGWCPVSVNEISVAVKAHHGINLHLMSHILSPTSLSCSVVLPLLILSPPLSSMMFISPSLCLLSGRVCRVSVCMCAILKCVRVQYISYLKYSLVFIIYFIIY